MLAPLRPEDQQAADDEGRGDHQRVEQISLDLLEEQQPQHRRRHEGDDQVQGKFACGRLPLQTGDDMTEPLPVDPDHRQYRRQLDGDLEYLAFVIVKMQQLAGNDQVASGRHRQEFGQALDDTQYRGLQNQ